MTGSGADRDASPRSRRSWPWLLAGFLLGVLLLALAAWTIWYVSLRPYQTAAAPPEPTLVVLTAPPVRPTTPAPTGPATTEPTVTPLTTPDAASGPAAITVGFYARVVDTDGLGVTVRSGPGLVNPGLGVAPEGSLLLVVDGPQEADNFTWWQIELEDGTGGWVAGDFLQPAAAG